MPAAGRRPHVVWRDPAAVVALLRCGATLPPLPAGSPAPRWGRVDGTEKVGCTAVGFPWAATRPGSARDTEQLFGFLPPLSGTVAGVQAITVLTAAPRERPAGGSAWAGMSGAGLFAGRFLVGVVVVDPAKFGPDRLHAAPLAPLLQDPELARLLDVVGAVQPVRLPDRLAVTADLTVGLRPPYQPLPDDVDPTTAPARLLLPGRGIVAFTGRGSQLRELRQWSHGGGRLALRVLTGAGGAGKTRLAAELCARLAGDGFDVGFADPGRPGGGLTLDYDRPTLIVVDDADLHVPLLAQLLTGLAGRPADAPPVRLLLLARHSFGWWDQLSRQAGDLADVYADPAVDLTGGQLGPDDRRDQYQAAAAAFGQLRRPRADGPTRRPEPAGTLSGLPDLADPAFANPLLVHMTALLAVFGDPAGPTEANAATGPGVREKVLAGVLRCEQARWQDTADYPGDTVGTAAVTLATLLTPASRPATLDALTSIADLADSASERGRAADWLHRLYPDPAGWLAPLRPDLLAEQLLATTSDLAGLVAAAHEHGGTTAAAQLLGELTRAGHQPPVAHALDRLLASHLPDLLDQVLADPAGRLTPVLDHALHHLPQPAAAAQLVGRLPERSISLAGLAATLTGQAVDHHRQRAATDPDAASDLTGSLNNLSKRLAGLGRREEALAAIGEAVDASRRLARARPDAFTPALASSLNNLSGALAALGRREEALAAIGEAVDASRRLARARPDAFTPALAMSLHNLSNRLAGLGRREEALAAIGEAVDIRRRLARARPDAFTPALASSLNNLSGALAGLGRREEALAAIGEAVDGYRRLARARPDAFTLDLASSLNNLSGALAELGRREEALAAIGEAVDGYRRLARARPDAFTPDLAHALTVLSIRLVESRRHREALAADREAVLLYRRLYPGDPDRFAEPTRNALTNLTIDLRDLGRSEEDIQHELDQLLASDDAD